MAHEPGRRTVGFSVTRLNIQVTTSEGDVVTIVKTGTITIGGVEYFALIDTEERRYVVIVNNDNGEYAVKSDMTIDTVNSLGQTVTKVYVEYFDGDEIIVENPHLLLTLHDNGMSFETAPYRFVIFDGYENPLRGFLSESCAELEPGFPTLTQIWSLNGEELDVMFTSTDEQKVLNCSKTAFIDKYVDDQPVYCAKPETVTSQEQWAKRLLISTYWLIVRGVDPSVLPDYIEV